MKVIYSLLAEPRVPLKAVAHPVTISGVQINWQIDGNEITGVQLIISGKTIRPSSKSGTIISYQPDLEVLAFQIASFVTDQIYVQTGIDAFRPSAVIGNSPVLEPETPAEEQMLKLSAQTHQRSISASAALCESYDTSSLAGTYRYATAIAHLARALRAYDPFVKYEEFYKVVEYFWPLKDVAFDAAVSTYAAPKDPLFAERKIKRMRLLRNRIIHPGHAPGHAPRHMEPHSLRNINEVKTELGDIERLAKFLVRMPPP